VPFGKIFGDAVKHPKQYAADNHDIVGDRGRVGLASTMINRRGSVGEAAAAGRKTMTGKKL
jgi:hypothetical protein